MNLTTAILKTLAHEGGFQKASQDNGNWSGGKVGVGELVGTKYGITSQDMPGVNIPDITQEQAIAYYQEHYVKPLYAQITDQALGEKLFDMGVLFGVGTAVKLLQITLANSISIVSDGNFGPQTLTDVNQHSNLLPAYRATLLNHCMNVVNANPNDAVFLHGWIARINS